MAPRNRLAAIFSPTRRLLSTDSEVIRPGGLLGPVEWIAPRSECQYRRIDFSQLPPRQRLQAAAIAARQEQATPDSTSRIAWTGGVAHIWTRRAARPSEPQAWLPESLLRPAPSVNGVRLLQLVRGYEGQVWRDGSLLASQWWAALPGQAEFARFLRSAGLTPGEGTAVPMAQSVGWGRPWATIGGAGASPERLERLGWQVLAAAMAIVLGWQVSAYQRSHAALRSVEKNLQAARQRALPLVEARERAEAAVGQMERLSKLQMPTSDYVLMARVLAPLAEDARFSAWQRQEGRLTVSVSSAESDPRAFVAAYSADPRLSRVQATPLATGGMQLSFDLDPPATDGKVR